MLNNHQQKYNQLIELIKHVWLQILIRLMRMRTGLEDILGEQISGELNPDMDNGEYKHACRRMRDR